MGQATIKERYDRLHNYHRRLYIEQVRMAACRLELQKDKDMSTQGSLIMWRSLLDRYQAIAQLERDLFGKGIFWVLTGRKWLLHFQIVRWLRSAESWKNKNFNKLGSAWLYVAAVALGLITTLVLMTLLRGN